MALTPEEQAIVGRFVRERVRRNARDTLRHLFSLDASAIEYSTDISPIIAGELDSEQIDESRNDGVVQRDIGELKAVLVILNKVRNSLTTGERDTLYNWLVGEII